MSSNSNTDFFHGVQGFVVNIGGHPIKAIRSSVVGIVVTAGMGPVNTPTLIFGNLSQAYSVFGPSLGDGFSAGQSLKAIFDQIGTLAVVVNVCDPSVHSSVIANEVVSLNRVNGKGNTAKRYYVGNPTVSNTVSAPVTLGSVGTWAVPVGISITGVKLAKGGTVVAGGTADGQWSVASGVLTVHGVAAHDQIFWITYTATLVRGTDFSVDSALGQITRLNASSILLAGADILASYTYVDPSKVTSTDVVGAPQTGDTPATGISAIIAAATKAGTLTKAKLLCAPGFSDQLAVGQALDEAAASLNGRAFVDGPNDTYQDSIAYGQEFASDVSRVAVHFPNYVIAHPVTPAAYLTVPASAYLCGLQSKVDQVDGKGNPYVSLSNKSLVGVAGLSRPVDSSIVSIMGGGSSSLQQFLNSNDIMTTILQGGWRAYGNTQANGDFICVQRMADFVIEAAALALVWAIDAAINGPALLDQILTTLRHFLRALEAQGALVANPSPDTDNDVWFPPELNTPDQTVQGIAYLNFRMNPPPPLQRLVVTGQLTNEFLKNLFAASSN